MPSAEISDPLQTPIGQLSFIEPAQAGKLKRLGLRTAQNLLWHLPRDVQDLGDVRAVSLLDPHRIQTVTGTVLDIDTREVKGGRILLTVLIDSGGERLRGVWFNQPWMRHKFDAGQQVAFSAKPKKRGGFWEMSHPKVQWLDPHETVPHLGVECIYPLTGGLKQYELQRILKRTVADFARRVPDPLPEPFLRQHNLLPIEAALRAVHDPQDVDQFHAGRHRLLHDELFLFQLALALRRKLWREDGVAPRFRSDQKIDSRIRRRFPFEFTDGQNSVIEDVRSDLSGDTAMHRLLQADVGAGKTVVAIYAVLTAIANGYQAAIMAPTEVLARQHSETLDELLGGSRVSRVLLTGSLTAAERKRAHRQIADGETDLVIGTHAVVQEAVKFRSLGLVVIDEQHKFGVVQRSRFSSGHLIENDSSHSEQNANLFPSKSRPETPASPHVMVMTATPIPRSLCLTQFGDLDVSVMRDLPPGRQPVVTSYIPTKPLAVKAFDFLDEQIEKGRQAYVICPRVEEDEESALFSVEEVTRRLRATVFKSRRVDCIHGRMDSAGKTEIMDRFRRGEIDVLVSTTVIEVGVNVPNATLMVIYQAEQFGLSQLHQLRGRICRGAFRGYCFLFSTSKSAEARERLRAVEATSDGFELAELDLQIRGPGDVLGTRQSGESPLLLADLRRDGELLQRVRKIAFELVASGKLELPDYRLLRQTVISRFADQLALPKTG